MSEEVKQEFDTAEENAQAKSLLMLYKHKTSIRQRIISLLC